MDAITAEGALTDIRKTIDAFIAAEESLDQRRLQSLSKIQVTMRTVIIAGMTSLFLVGGICAWFFGRGIVTRLAILNENVSRFMAGEALRARVSGGDEVATLDDSFHRMAEELTRAAAKEKEFQANLERRAVELTTMNRELTLKREENEMFVYSVSHDLRSPLVNLQGFSKELSLAMKEMRAVVANDAVPSATRLEAEDIINQGMAEPVTFIQTAVTRLSAIIDALLRLSRAGRVEYQRKEVEIEPLVQRVIDSMHAVVAEKKAHLFKIGPFPRVWGDPTAIEQIFANLIGNAINYLDKNRAGIIEVGVIQEDSDPEMAVIYVKDTGLGIPSQYLAKVFGIFQRVHGNVAVGEGIGLALVKRMVERHGGRTWADSKEGEGSTFFVALPMVVQEVTASTLAAENQEPEEAELVMQS